MELLLQALDELEDWAIVLAGFVLALWARGQRGVRATAETRPAADGSPSPTASASSTQAHLLGAVEGRLRF